MIVYSQALTFQEQNAVQWAKIEEDMQSLQKAEREKPETKAQN